MRQAVMSTDTRGSQDIRGAILSDDKKYRYHLWRRWSNMAKTCVFIMLNPSTADDTTDDPTIRRCIRFAQDWGYGGIHVVNLFALRATDPVALWGSDRLGPENNKYIVETATAEGVGIVVCAWGAGKYPHIGDREQVVRQMLAKLNVQLAAIKKTKFDAPAHPLYLPAHLKPIRYP